jgi:uncharacterized protein with beta-barrel porin domain
MQRACTLLLFSFFSAAVTLILALMSADCHAQTFSGVQITRTGAPYTIGARNIAATFTTARLLIITSFPGDSVTELPEVLPLSTVPGFGLGFAYTFGIGNTPGVRIIRFCVDNGVTACDPAVASNVIHIGATNAFLCTLDATPLNVDINQTVNASASCDTSSTNLGTNISVSSISYGWSTGGTQPNSSASNSYSFATAGSFDIQITPSITFSINRTVGPSVGPSTPSPNTAYVAPTAMRKIIVGPPAPPSIEIFSATSLLNVIRDRPVSLGVRLQNLGSNVVESVSYFEQSSAGITTQIGSERIIAPYAIEWVPTSNGSKRLTARMKLLGVPARIISSDIVAFVSSAANTLPQVRMLSPSDQQSFEVSAGVLLSASAQDADGIERVQFFLTQAGSAGPQQIGGDDRSAPYEVPLPANLPSGDYSVFARAFDLQRDFNDSTMVNFAIGMVIGISDQSSTTQRRFNPNAQVQLPVLVTAGSAPNQQPLANQDLVWRIAASDIGGNSGNCTPTDSPASGTLRSDSTGLATIRFQAGCSTGGKRIEIALAQNPNVVRASITLSGPDQAVATISSPSATGNIYYVTPGIAEPVRVQLSGADLNALQGGAVTWTLPAGQGALAPSTSTIDNGVASSSINLAAGVSSAQITACVRGRDLCTTLIARSIVGEVEQAVAQLSTPMQQAAIDAPRVQMSLLSSRMQRARNEGGHGFSNDVSVSLAGWQVPTDDEVSAADGAQASKFGVFALGSIDIAKRGGGKNAGGYSVDTHGLTLGVDYRFSAGFTAGLALGGLRAGSDAQIVTQDTTGYSASVFAQYLPTEQWYFAGVFNRGRNSYDMERTGMRAILGGASNVKLQSTGSSTQSAVQLESGYSFASGSSKFTPYLRYEYIRARLSQITERGGPEALVIRGYDSALGTLSGGLQADWVINTGAGVLIPGARVEFVSEQDHSDQVFAQLASNVSGFLPINDTPVDQRYGTAGLSLQWLTGIKGQPISVFFGFDYLFGRDQFDGRSLSLGVKVPL